MLTMQAKLKHLKGLFALDLGTTKFCLACLREAPPDPAPRVEVVSVAADGMRRGMLANVAQAKTALASLIAQAEKQFDTDINRVIVGVAGSHLQSRCVKVSMALSGASVTHSDVLALVDKAETEHARDGREMLHAVPISFRLDAREEIDDPVGFSGHLLSGDFFVIDADKLYLKDLVELCNSSGLQVVRLYAEPFASASVTVPDSFKKLGVALADIGGGTTDGIVFRNHRPLTCFTVNVAGRLMTSDIAIGLNLAHDEAEAVKLRFGIKPRTGDSCEVTDSRGQLRLVAGDESAAIMRARVHELGALIAHELKPFRGTLGAGLLLTGGGAGVQGIVEYFEKGMGIPVGRAKPILSAAPNGSSIIEPEQVLRSPQPTKLATVIGLLNLELCRLSDMAKNKKLSWANRYLGQFVNWLKELS